MNDINIGSVIFWLDGTVLKQSEKTQQQYHFHGVFIELPIHEGGYLFQNSYHSSSLYQLRTEQEHLQPYITILTNF